MNLTALKSWVSGETLTAADLNAEFQNIYTHTINNSDIDSTASYVLGELVIGTGLAAADGGQLHVHTGSAGTVQAASDADEAVFENSTASGITILSGGSSTGKIAFGDSGDNDVGLITYNHATNALTLGTNGTTALTLSSAQAATFAGDVSVGGTLTLTGGITLNGNTTIGDSSADTLTVNSTITSNLIFTDATYDIGASGATRPRDLFLSRNAVMGGTLGVTGLITASGGVSGALTGNVTGNLTGNVTGDVTGNISGNVTGGTISGTTATLTGALTGTTGTFSGLISGNGGAEIGSNTAKVKFYSDSTYSGIYNGSSLTSDESYYFGNGDHFWYSDGSVAMKLDSSIVGIGTSSPSTYSFNNDARLVVANTSANSTITIASGTSSSGYLAFADGTTGTDRYSGQVQYNHSTNTMSFKTGGGVEAMTINSAQDLAVDGDTLYIDASADRVGINTSSPDSVLHLYKSGSLAQLKIEANGVANPRLALYNNLTYASQITYTNDLQVYGNGGSNLHLVLDSSGYLGLGTNNPTGLMNLMADGATPFTGVSDVLLDIKRGVTNTGSGNATAIRLGNNSNGFKISYGGAADHLQFIDGGNSAIMTLVNANNNVGIGTESPACRTHIRESTLSGFTPDNNTNLAVEENSTSLIEIAGTDSGILFSDATAWAGRIFYTHSTDQMAFATAQSNKMYLDSSGNLLVGKTTTSAATAGASISSTGAATFVRDSDCLLLNRPSTTGTIAAFRQANTEVGTISVTASTTSYNTTSDYRLKENVVGITDGITRIKSLKPSRFNFISNADQTVDGFVAHEVSDIVPEAITGEKDAVDDEGNPEYQGIDQSKLVPLLTAALQEAITKIETLETKVAALEAA